MPDRRAPLPLLFITACTWGEVETPIGPEVLYPCASTAGLSREQAGSGLTHCVACRGDSSACEYDINCQLGSICNSAGGDHFREDCPTHVCVRIVCASDDDCVTPKTCSLRGVCEARPCEGSRDCAGNMICVAGECVAKAPVARCLVVSARQTLELGQTAGLAAVAFDESDRPRPDAAFVWTSSSASAKSKRLRLSLASPAKRASPRALRMFRAPDPL